MRELRHQGLIGRTQLHSWREHGRSDSLSPPALVPCAHSPVRTSSPISSSFTRMLMASSRIFCWAWARRHSEAVAVGAWRGRVGVLLPQTAVMGPLLMTPSRQWERQRRGECTPGGGSRGTDVGGPGGPVQDHGGQRSQGPLCTPPSSPLGPGTAVPSSSGPFLSSGLPGRAPTLWLHLLSPFLGERSRSPYAPQSLPAQPPPGPGLKRGHCVSVTLAELKPGTEHRGYRAVGGTEGHLGG